MRIKTAFLGVFILISAFTPASASDRILKIGVAGAMTGSQTSLGMDIVHAAQMAVDAANEAKLIPGVSLVLEPIDDKSDPREAVSAAHRLAADDEVVAVLGHLTSGCSIPAAAVYQDADLLMITPSSTNPKLTRLGYSNVFRVCTTDMEQGLAAGAFAVRTQNKKRFAIIHDKTEYGQGLAEEFKKQVIVCKGNVVHYEGVTAGDQDYTAVLTKIKTRQPDVIYFAGMYPEGVLIVTQMRQAGITAEFMSGDGLYTPEYIRLAGKASDGTIVSFLAPPYDKVRSARNFIRAFKKRYKEVKTYAPYAYDAANIIIQAVARAAKAGDFSRARIVREVRQIGEYNGVIGKTSFDEKGDTRNKQIYFYIVRKDQFIWYRAKDAGDSMLK